MKPENHNPLIQENKILSTSLHIAQAWVQFLKKAYDALLHHGINYRNLPEYNDPRGLLKLTMDPKVSMDTGEKAALEYLENSENGLDAAIRRKGFKEVQ